MGNEGKCGEQMGFEAFQEGFQASSVGAGRRRDLLSHFPARSTGGGSQCLDHFQEDQEALENLMQRVHVLHFQLCIAYVSGKRT